MKHFSTTCARYTVVSAKCDHNIVVTGSIYLVNVLGVGLIYHL